MANQELYNKTYSVPSDVIKYISKVLISYSQGNGVKRAKFIVKNGILSYSAMKKLKHEMEHMDKNSIQYHLAGGNSMEAFINTALNQDRAGVKRAKEVKRDMTANPNSELNPYQTPRLNEETKKEKKKNAVAVIVDDDNKILLLKRADVEKMWMPNKWALVGGGVEKGESPEQACKREIQEETGLEISKFIKSFSIERNEGSIEFVFACRYNGDPTDITLNDENTNYGWYDVGEMKYLDTVPHLIEFITLVFKKYE